MRTVFTLLSTSFFLVSLAAQPTIPSSNFTFNSIDGAFFNLGWTAGNGARRLMVAKAGSEPGFVPTNGTTYTANTEFGKGQEVAPGEFIVYDHFSSSFFLTGLTPSTHYYFRLFEYNGTGPATEYLKASFLSGDGSTSSPPTVQTSNAGFSTITTNSVTLNWTNGNGQRRIVVVKEGSPVSIDPTNSEPYSGANSVFGTAAASLGNGNYAVYRSSSNFTTVTNLKAGTAYFFAFYEFNGNQQPQYLKPAYTTSVTTRSAPTVPSTDAVISKTDGKELTLNWTNGNGQRRIVIARQGSNVTSLPVDGTDYNADAVFGQGQQLAAGEYVVYDDNFHSAVVSGLLPGTTYFFKVFEYDGTGSSTVYLTSEFASVNGATATSPTVQSQVLPSTNLTSSSLRLNFTPGNGRARLVLGRAGSPVDVTPDNFSVYTDNTRFGTGQDLGNGNFALAYTTEASLGIQGLQPNTTYHFAVFELNGFNQPLYLAPAAVTSATTLGTLPVKLLNWEALADGNEVRLQWKTAMEANTSHFVVERSADGSVFTAFATVNALGNSTGERTYSAKDDRPATGKVYYRLRMVDKDGTWEYSAIRTVQGPAGAAVRVLENPVRNNLPVVSAMGQKAVWKIVNAAGQIVCNGPLQPGKNELPVSTLAPGCYWLLVNDAKTTVTTPFIKQ